MLKIAQEYEDVLKEKIIHTWYDKKYLYYAGGPGDFSPELPPDNYSSHNFVSLNKRKEVIGYIGYSVSWELMSVNGLSVIGFSNNIADGNIFVKDILKAINDIFCKYNMNRLEFWCCSDNPAIRGYRNFIKKCGGKEIGTFRDSTKLQDGRLHNQTYFEILHSDWINKGINPKYFES